MSVTPSPLTASSSALSHAALTVRLRAAGCVFAEDEADLLLATARTPGELAAMAERRALGLPLEHVLGWAEFRGLRIEVDPGVFVPRRRTEFLIDRATTLAAPDAVVVDLCCGSGALGAALVSSLGRAELYAADLDPAAVACARRNVAGLGGRVFEGDLYAPLPASLRGRVGILLANVPYVPTSEVAFLPPEARDHEAQLALDGGSDGLDVLRRVTAEAAHWLAPGGHLLFETSEQQAGLAADIVAGDGLVPRIETCEDLYATVITGTRPN
ncbi:putative protein N(5)-glutamine methyltransferase [Streptomyces sp. NBC_01304]|uniref:putative protein N(5)-glutamine methyltransferase n=1 Tax=Streptomyces sp. NBC_01304 TaxID=2903818 RepID=UPI002E143BE3|nr:putative protein N(5)-glutamine methyltransferase [Streptomyces sp. NBC_01304]